MKSKVHILSSWRLVPTDKQPQGTKPTLSLRGLEKLHGQDMESRLDPRVKNMTVKECVERYLATKTGVKPNAKMNYGFVQNLMEQEEFYGKKIHEVKVSDAKLFLIKFQQDGRGHSTIKTVRGVLRPAFQMAMDDDILVKNPFQFKLAVVIVNDSVTREVITKDEMRKFLKFVHDDVVYYKYYEVVFILFHIGMRIPEFCGLTIKDIDMEKKLLISISNFSEPIWTFILKPQRRMRVQEKSLCRIFVYGQSRIAIGSNALGVLQ